MTTQKKARKTTSESIVREIKHNTRRKFTAEEKIRIVLDGLRGEGLHPTQYYKWSKVFLEAGKSRLNGDTIREAGSDEVKGLRDENDELKILVAELTLRNRRLKKTSPDLEYGSIDRYQENGYNGLALKYKNARQVWNTIPKGEKERVVEVARRYPEKSSREIACLITDGGSFISESSVYRILKSYDLVTSPAYIVISAKDHFEHPTTRINELWQTDFTYFKVKDWGWYYLSTVMDDFSRYILAWQLCRTMKAKDVKETLDMAIERTGVEQVHVVQRPRLLSDNGPCYISRELKSYLEKQDIRHIRTRVYHPMTQGKIDRAVSSLDEKPHPAGSLLQPYGADREDPGIGRLLQQ